MTRQRRPAKALAAIGLAMATAAAALAASSVPGGAQVPDPQMTPAPTAPVPGDAQAADTPASTAPAPPVPGGAQAAADPQVTLDPATDLVDGSRVTVTVTGFAANTSVEAMQCPSGNGSFDGCDF